MTQQFKLRADGVALYGAVSAIGCIGLMMDIKYYDKPGKEDAA